MGDGIRWRLRGTSSVFGSSRDAGPGLGAYGPVRQRYLCKLRCPALGYAVNWVPDAIMSLNCRTRLFTRLGILSPGGEVSRVGGESRKSV